VGRGDGAARLEHFPEKWAPIFRRKCDKIKDLALDGGRGLAAAHGDKKRDKTAERREHHGGREPTDWNCTAMAVRARNGTPRTGRRLRTMLL
jgi:hypothetical protein